MGWCKVQSSKCKVQMTCAPMAHLLFYCHCERSAAIHKPTPRPAGTPAPQRGTYYVSVAGQVLLLRAPQNCQILWVAPWRSPAQRGGSLFLQHYEFSRPPWCFAPPRPGPRGIVKFRGWFPEGNLAPFFIRPMSQQTL